MKPIDMLHSALKSGDVTQAIRLISSVKELQTKANFLICCKDSSSAFDLLKFVPASREIKGVIEVAAIDTRVARLIAEDLPELVNDSVLRSAIDGEQAWADRYKIKYKLSASHIKELMFGSKGKAAKAPKNLTPDAAI